MSGAADPSRGRVDPVETPDRPLWSVMIPTYNCANYLRTTLASVLAQDPGPALMQIEVVDDASGRDDPEAVVAEFDRGRVAFHRQERNVGHVANFNTCIARARGRYVHLLHGDDMVLDGFYRQMAAGLDAHPEAGAAFCRHEYIDETGRQVWLAPPERETSGLLDDWLARIAVRQLIQTPSIVVRREVYEALGTFDRRFAWVEDWEMWCRIAAGWRFWYEPETLAAYRVHRTSITGNAMRTGANLRDARQAVDVVQAYLPPEIAQESRRRALEHFADDAVRVRIPILLRNGDWEAARNQLREALQCSRSPRVLREAARLVPVALRQALRRS